jgi:hypothetical protein
MHPDDMEDGVDDPDDEAPLVDIQTRNYRASLGAARDGPPRSRDSDDDSDVVMVSELVAAKKPKVERSDDDEEVVYPGTSSAAARPDAEGNLLRGDLASAFPIPPMPPLTRLAGLTHQSSTPAKAPPAPRSPDSSISATAAVGNLRLNSPELDEHGRRPDGDLPDIAE